MVGLKLIHVNKEDHWTLPANSVPTHDGRDILGCQPKYIDGLVKGCTISTERVEPSDCDAVQNCGVEMHLYFLVSMILNRFSVFKILCRVRNQLFLKLWLFQIRRKIKIQYTNIHSEIYSKWLYIETVTACVYHHVVTKPMCITYIDGLVQDCSNSIADALELLQSCTKSSICNTEELLLHILRAHNISYSRFLVVRQVVEW